MSAIGRLIPAKLSRRGLNVLAQQRPPGTPDQHGVTSACPLTLGFPVRNPPRDFTRRRPGGSRPGRRDAGRPGDPADRYRDLNATTSYPTATRGHSRKVVHGDGRWPVADRCDRDALQRISVLVHTAHLGLVLPGDIVTASATIGTWCATWSSTQISRRRAATPPRYGRLLTVEQPRWRHAGW